MNWLLAGNPAVEVFARGQSGFIKGSGYSNTNDVTWAIVTCSDGAVVNFGVCYALPQHYPSLGHAARVELLGTDGVLIIDDDHTDQLMYSEHTAPHVYSDHNVNMAFLGSGTPDWALGDSRTVASETRAWLDHLSMGRACVLATADDARCTLKSRSRSSVRSHRRSRYAAARGWKLDLESVNFNIGCKNERLK